MNPHHINIVRECSVRFLTKVNTLGLSYPDQNGYRGLFSKGSEQSTKVNRNRKQIYFLEQRTELHGVETSGADAVAVGRGRVMKGRP